MPDLLLIEPVFAARVWGGHELERWFAGRIPDGVIGECWSISGMPGMSGHLMAGGPSELTLADAWAQGLVTGRPEAGSFPLLCKLLDPQDWLSVQVHPDDAQAQALEDQPRGKAECWLILHAQEDAELILGHRAETVEELRRSLDDGTMLDLLVHVPVQQDDFFMVGAGEVHSLGPGLLVYEVQQSSDITYRLYDFDRVGLDGTPRELHIDKGFAVVHAPHDPRAARTAGPWTATGVNARWRVLTDVPQFRVERWETLHGSFQIQSPQFWTLTIVSGGGWVSTADEEHEVGLGTSLVIPAGAGPVTVRGDLISVATHPGPLAD